MIEQSPSPLSLSAFLALNEGMALHYVISCMRAVEQDWEVLAQRSRRYQRLLEILSWSSQHRSPKLRELSALSRRFPSDPSYHQFMSVVAPLERTYGRAVADGDFAVTHTDRQTGATFALRPITLVLENIRSAFNVGSMLRTAECMAVAEVILCGYSPVADDAKVQKASLGSEAMIKTSWSPYLRDSLINLKKAGLTLCAFETSPLAIPLPDWLPPPTPLALVFGNERYGLEEESLKLVDHVIQIPCLGRKNSLNVGVAVGMALGELRRQELVSVHPC